MEENEINKIVFWDAGREKIIRGTILKDEEFTLIIKAIRTNAIITIGKRAVISITPTRGDFNE